MTRPPFAGAQDLTLLMTKLYVPRPWPNLVERPRLIKRLDEGLRLGHRLILICAPAGFGKTTLISDWLQQIKSRTPVAWLSLDESDNEVTRFLTYAIAALQQIDDGLGHMALSLLQSPQPSPLENLITLLINDIAALPSQAVLVVDDYHVISSSEINNAVSFLLANLPPQLHLVIASREDPMLPLPRLRVGRQVTEIRTKDLRFTQEEAAHFLNRSMGLNLTPKDVAALERRTEGWAAGLQMAALSLQDVADPTGFIAAFAGDDRYVVDYLISEVVERQPTQIREFLLKTGFLDRLTAPLCDVVTGRDDGRDSLTYLEGANLFMIPLDNKRQWYRYHHLFRDLLRYRLREEVGAEGTKELHGRAAVWYAQNGFSDDAIHHYLAAQDYDHAADLMESLAVNLIVQGQLRQVRGWLEALPGDFIRGRPLLCVCYAWVLNLAGEAAAVEPLLRAAERALPSAPAAEGKDIQGLINSLHAFVARRQGDIPSSIEYLRQAVADLAPDNLWVRSSVNLNLGFNYLLTGQLARAEGALQAARADAEASGAAYVRLIAIAVQANTYLAQGKLSQAGRLFEEAIAAGLDQNRGQPYPPAGYAYAGLGQLLYERNELEAAEGHLAQAVELGELMADWSIIRRGLLPLAWLKQQRGEDAEAQALWGRALKVVRQAESKRVEAQLMTHQARLWLARAGASPGNPSALAAAEEWAKTYRQSQPDPGSYPQALAQMTLAWVELAQGRPDQSLACLEPLAEAAAAGGWIDTLIKILALQALAQAAQRDSKSALDTLKRAFDLAAAEGYVRTFIDYGPPMRQLLQQAAMRGLATDYVSKLLAACSAEEPADTPSPPPPSPAAPQPLIEPLTERELAILRLMAANLSHREIAEELYLSVNTVKWHSTHIYSKLGVHRRADAVARAQQLGIL
jgi:LuxR family maltose regulon positive regulatory protein